MTTSENNKKIEIKICVGTLCYIMGGAELQLLEENIPEELKNRVDIKGSQCLDLCKDGHTPPIVTINGEPMFEATIAKIVNHISNI